MRSRAAKLLRRALWSVPITITFTDNVASVIRVDGSSMQPCLNPSGPGGPSDWVLVEKTSVKLLQQYTRGEVVVLWAPDNPHQQIIKRLLALEGDTLLEDDPASTGPAASSSASSRSSSSSTSSVAEVPQGRCWVEGDNASASGDSKTAYGPVHLGLLEGRVSHIVWPPARAGRVPVQPQPQRLLHTQEGPLSLE